MIQLNDTSRIVTFRETESRVEVARGLAKELWGVIAHSYRISVGVKKVLEIVVMVG